MKAREVPISTDLPKGCAIHSGKVTDNVEDAHTPGVEWGMVVSNPRVDGLLPSRLFEA